MMRAVLVLLIAATSGCLASANVRGSRNGFDGVGIAYEGPVSRLRFGVEAVYERVATDAERRGVFGYDATARVGFVSMVLRERCTESCVVNPWLDFGPGVGVGLAATGDLALLGHVWIGGWADVRVSNAHSFPVVRLELQQDGYSSEFRGDTQLVLGVGFVDWDWSLK